MTYKEGPMNLRTLAAFVIGVAAAGTVSAQSVTLRAKIPFSFVVRGQTLPAGEYAMLPENGPYVIVIQGIDHRAAVGAVVYATSGRSFRKQTPRLVFNVYGNQYFLSQIWSSGDQGSQLPMSRSERELVAHRHVPSQSVVAALRSF
jgi:hypothetical protein